MDSSLGRSISFGPFRLYPTARVIERDGTRLALGSRALDLLIVLADCAGEVVSHRELTQRVWRDLVVSPGSLRVHIAGLRKALGDGDGESRYIANLPGQGYCLVAPVSRSDVYESRAAAPAPAEPAIATPNHNLPNQLTSFIGREKEIQQINGLLASVRLLTLTGAGGCGKTRLALQLAADVSSGFCDGCRLVELAPLGDSTLVMQTVANVLVIKERPNTLLADAIADHLATKHLLLVLDNAEHLIAPCAALAELLLRRCSRLQILVTSREPLGVGGELTYRVPSLSVPEADAATSDAVFACEATRLFVERACLHRPDFEITPRNARTITSICRQLDGIALAIELAAPRLRTMSIEELNHGLNDRFHILTGGHRTALPRHRTLRSLIDWSHDLLNLPEKTLLRRVAVFSGGWTVDSAESVCAGDGVGSSDVLDLLTSLTDKSLLWAQAHGDVTRFGVLETVRQYAWDRLRESGEEAGIRVRHLAFFLALAERLDAEQDDSQRAALLGRIDLEHDNMRAALAWCEATVAHRTPGLRLAGTLDWFWRTRGHHEEGFSWTTRLLAVTAPAASTEDHAVAHHTAGKLASEQGNLSAAEQHCKQALVIFQELARPKLIARSLGNLGAIAFGRGDNAAARGHFEQALAIARQIGDGRSIALGLNALGLVATNTGDLATAQDLFEEALGVARKMGQWTLTADALVALGNVTHLRGDLHGARELLMEALKAARAFGNKFNLAGNLTQLAILCHDLEDIAAARAHIREALSIEQATDDRKHLAFTLETLAGVALEFAAPDDAVRLFGCAERLREEIGGLFPAGPIYRPRHERFVAAARSAMGDDAAFDRAWSAGRSMTIAEAMRYALDA